MASTCFFEKTLRGSDWGTPTDRDTTGYDVEIKEFGGFVHIEMRSAVEGKKSLQTAAFSLSEAKEFVAGFQDAIRRVEALGEQ